ncbi:hypothetical protein K501DRAFT_158237, partial [Backusella circina FSU 941]
MATVRKRRSNKSGHAKNTRRTADRRLKRVTITGNSIIKANWDKTQTLRQNYKRLGLLTSINGQSGGIEKLNPDKKITPEEQQAQQALQRDLSELTEEEIQELKKTLKPGEGLIQRDDDGNVVRVLVGEQKTHNEILDQEFDRVEAKTDVVRQLEEQAANAKVVEKFVSEYQGDWIQQLMQKHGDDYQAMFWDKELNTNQLTAAQLKKKCAKYLSK